MTSHFQPSIENKVLTRSIVKETWLSQKPNSWAFVAGAFSTLLLVLGSIIYIRNWGGAFEWMPATAAALFSPYSFWRAWTALLAHADEKHLLSNSFLFFILGSFLTGYFGYWIFPVMAFVFGGLINFIVVSYSDPQITLVGASGMVFWMGGLWLTLYFLLDIKHSLYQRSLRALGVGLMLFFPAQAFDPHISYSSHFVGFALGIFCAAVYYFLNKKKFDSAVVRELIVEEI